MKAVFVALVLCVVAASAADWAVIVAGSNTWSNYRHQSDACHAVQIALKNGIHPDNIISMIYDDIAANSRNPFPGEIFNKPTPKGTPGHNVYAGCQMDYTGKDVTAANFMNVLTGNAAAMQGVGNGKVLRSTKADNVFIYFSDHGGVGIIAFPVGPYLSVNQLQTSLKTMTQRGLYGKLVFYMEACESGSMFEGTVATNTNIYVTTAANAHESSWGFYCPPQDQVNGKSVGSCLGDEYSIAFLESADTDAGLQMNLDDHYAYMKVTTKKSHVMQYGDQNFAKTSRLIDFLGGASKVNKTFAPLSERAPVPVVAAAPVDTESGRVSSRDIPMHLSYYEYLRADHSDLAGSHAKAQALIAEIEHRVKSDNVFLGLAKAVVPENHVSLFTASADYTAVCGECCDAVNTAVYNMCGGYSDYSMKYARVVHNICVSQPGMKDVMLHTLKALCL